MRERILGWVVMLATLVGGGFLACEALGQDRPVGALVNDLVSGRNPQAARRTLKEIDDRDLVLKALKNALEEEGGAVRGKKELLRTLRELNEEGMARRALWSPSLTTRRAAALVMPDAAELLHFYRCAMARTLITWLEDEQADHRDLEEAASVLIEVVGTLGKTRDNPKLDAEILKDACKALSDRGMEGLGPTVLAFARDPDRDNRIRGAAFDALERIEDAPRGEVQQLMLDTVTDTSADIALRVKAAFVLVRKRYADGKAVAALEQVLFDPKDTDWPGGDRRECERHWMTQRSCLLALSRIAPLGHLREVLLDPRVSKHPYFGIRADVAAGLASLSVTNRRAFDILCEYLVEEDPRDRGYRVRQEAWLSLWTLTGLAYGVPEPQAFASPPQRGRDEDLVRRRIFAQSVLRPGVDRRQVQIVRRAARDLAAMKKACRMFLGRWEAIQRRWNEAGGAR